MVIMKRNNFLDVLKGICILLVILTHFDWTEAQRLKYLFPYWMNPAVPIFMIISGYLYSESFKRKEVTTFSKAYAFSGIIDKVLRYTIPLIMIYIIEVPLKMYVFDTTFTPWQIFCRLWVGGWGPGSYYYLYMIQLIFIFPLVYFAICKWDFKGLVLLTAVNALYEIIKVPMNISDGAYRLIVLRYTFAMSLGCYFSIGKFKIKKWMGIASLIFGAVFIYAVCYGGYTPIFFNRWSRTSMLAVFYVAPIMYLLINKVNWNCRPLSAIGKASYNIFLVQMVYFHLANRIFDGISGNFGGMITAYSICIVLGLLFYKVQNYFMPTRKIKSKEVSV